MPDPDCIALTFRLGKPEELPSVADAIAAHHDIAQAHGHAALGKTGRALATPTIDRAIAPDRPTLLIITRSGADFHAHCAPIHDILSHPHAPAEHLIPRYYRHLRHDIRTWIMIGPITPLPAETLATTTLRSNNRPLLEVLRTTRTANMLVRMLA
ncbi:MAG: hypothetical protein EA402_04535 [Planctomycetota bacterium]|nr:MAG: hypothetical protein EA402_04535 [Planctomycetota bacterium]